MKLLSPAHQKLPPLLPRRRPRVGFRKKVAGEKHLDLAGLMNVINGRCGCTLDCFKPFRSNPLLGEWLSLRKNLFQLKKLEKDNWVRNWVIVLDESSLSFRSWDIRLSKILLVTLHFLPWPDLFYFACGPSMRSSTHWKRTFPPPVEASGVLFGRTSLCAPVGLWSLYQLERVAFAPSTKLPKMGKHPAHLIYGFVLGVNNQWVQRLNAYTSSWPNFMKKQRSVCRMASTPTNGPDNGKTDSTPQKWIVIMSSTCRPEHPRVPCPMPSTLPPAYYQQEVALLRFLLRF